MKNIEQNIGVEIDVRSTATACRTNCLPHAARLPAKSNLKAQLLAALKTAQPQIGKDYLYDRCVDKYVAAILPAICAAVSLSHKNNDLLPNQFYFCQSKIREEIGTIGKQQDYIYQLMREHITTSLLVVIRKGFSKNGVSKLSAVAINPIYEELIVEELLNLRIEPNIKLLDEIEQNANYTVNVDPASLASFINKTTATIRETTKGSDYKEKLFRNLMAAKQLQSMIHKADEKNPTPYLNERWEMADSGRIYGQGYSLQRMTKEVRHAALGVCHKYDFKACAFALMAGLAHAIDGTLRTSAILDYIKNRQVIRKQIAAELNISEALVKTIFTSLGFGAELKNNQHNAIRGALAKAARQQHDMNVRLERDIYNNLGADEFARLVANRTFKYIYDELQQINSTILAYYKTNELVIGDATYNAIDKNTGKRRSDKQKLAWIYQALESQAMQMFAKLAKQDELLTAHDCIYFKQKLPASVCVDATYLLQQTYPYLRFEHEAIYPIADNVQYAARFADTDLIEQEHRNCIAAEMRAVEIKHIDAHTSPTANDQLGLQYNIAEIYLKRLASVKQSCANQQI